MTLLHNGRKRISALACLAYLLLSVPSADAISWQSDLSSAIKKAKEDNKPVMVDFYTDWCSWCKKLDKDTYGNRVVNETAQNFICVKVNGDKSGDLTAKYMVQGYPTVIFLSPSGAETDRIRGYCEPGKFAGSMKKALSSVRPTAGKEAGSKEGVDLFGGVVKINTGPKFRLEGVVSAPEGYKAMINGSLVGVGETVEGAEVLTISKRIAKLKYRGKELTIELK